MVRNIFVLCSLLFGDMVYGEMSYSDKERCIVSESLSEPLENLFSQFKQYYLNAPWVIDSCMALSVDDCLLAWREVVLLFASKESRWYYFSDSEERYLHDVQSCIWQCRQYDEWLRSTRIDEKNKSLYALRIGEKSDDKTILQYCCQKNQVEMMDILYIFYSFYIDCLTHAFEEYIENIRIFENDAELCIGYCRLARKCLEKIDSFAQATWLKNSPWYLDYELAIQKLHEVLVLIDDEYGFAL